MPGLLLGRETCRECLQSQSEPSSSSCSPHRVGRSGGHTAHTPCREVGGGTLQHSPPLPHALFMTTLTPCWYVYMYMYIRMPVALYSQKRVYLHVAIKWLVNALTVQFMYNYCIISLIQEQMDFVFVYYAQ